MNYKVLGMLMAICVCLVAVEAVVAVDSGSYVLVSSGDIGTNETIGTNDTFNTPTSLTSSKINMTIKEPAYNNTRLSQGQCVEIGGVYDVSGVIGFSTDFPYNAFAYYGRYEMGFDPFNEWYNLTNTYVYTMPDRRTAYYNFLVDKNIFGERQGYWYQFNGEFERAANKRAFYVSDRCIQPVSNATTMIVNNTPIVINPRIIPARHVSDIVLSNDDPLYLTVPDSNYSLWVFGYGSTSVMDRKLNLDAYATEKMIFNSSTSNALYSGNYNVLLQSSGANKIYDVSHVINERGSEPRNLLIPALRSIDIVDVTGLQSKLVEEKLVNILKQTDDPYVQYEMAVQEPYVDISAYNEIIVGSGNQTLLEVTGYTNKMPNTPVTLYYDRENVTKQSVKYQSMTVMVDNGSIGDYRTFHGYLPLNYDNMPPGFHTLSAVLPSGAFVSIDFYVRAELEPHHEDPKVYNFIDGNPFYVPPPPVIVEKEVIKEVEKIVVKTETVYIPVDYNTLAQETLNKALPIVAAVVIIGLPALYGCILAIRVYAERRLKKLSEKKGVEK